MISREIKESTIRDQVFEYLVRRYPMPKSFFLKDRQGVTKPGKGTMPGTRGISDIWGIWNGKPFACEVKRPEGVLSQAQFQFLTHFKEAGGIAIVVTSIEDVQRELGIR